jgi:hypothetical protein
MRVWPSPSQTNLIIAGITAAGFALTLYVFYPGVITFDALYIYKDMAKGTFGDWQSPAMLALWSFIDPIAPGTGSILLLTVTLYWLSFALAALAISRRSPQLAVLVPILALLPPAFVLVGLIWRDILFAIVWMLGAAAVFVAAERDWKLRVPVQMLAFALFSFGVLLRPNALAAAPLLAAYLIWPKRFSWKRTALLYVPAALGLYGLVQVVYTTYSMRSGSTHCILLWCSILAALPISPRKTFFPAPGPRRRTTSSPTVVIIRSHGTFIGRNSRVCL